MSYRLNQAYQRAMIRCGRPKRIARANGLRFQVRRLTCDESFVTNIVTHEEYTRHGVTLHAGMTVLDIGANIGVFSVFAASKGCRVIAVEPDPTNLALLHANIAQNGLRVRDRVTVIEAAAAGVDGSITLHRHAEGGYHSVLANYDRTYADAITVPALSLASVMPEVCHVLKIDCEGAEFEILAHAPAEILRRAHWITMEYHTPPNLGLRVETLTATLTRAGFRIVHVEPFAADRGGHLWAQRTH